MNYILFAILVILNVLDIYYSRIAFNIGISESNPVIELVVAKYSFTGMIAVKGFFLVILAILLPFARTMLVTLSLIAVIGCYTWVVLEHIKYLGG